MPPLEMPTQQPRDMDELPRPFELVASVRATPVGPTVTKETKETKEAKETKGRAAGMAEVPQSKVPGAEAEHEVQRSAVPTSLLRDTRTGPGASTPDAVDPDTDAQRQRQLSRKRSRQEFRATRGPGTAELTAERQDAVDQLLASSPLVRGIELTLGVLGDSETKVTRPADTDHGRPAVQVPLAVAPSTMPSDPQETDSNSDSEPDDPEETDPRQPAFPGSAPLSEQVYCPSVAVLPVREPAVAGPADALCSAYQQVLQPRAARRGTTEARRHATLGPGDCSGCSRPWTL